MTLGASIKEPVVKVRELHKEFLLSHSGVGSIKTLLLWWKRRYVEHLKVLNGISFDVYPGECLAVIGRNGAGKSTLLSLLARIYKPTSGTAEVRGRVAPLLELGAGFHGDLTGLQNIYVNAAILGLTKKEIDERLDQIVQFSELINHIDSPVRTYSSGMSARLGFAVAIHVDADVLLMDEVLAVGDFAFRTKCHEKLDELRAQGKTILVVSHGASDIERLADRCIWLQNGKIEMEGDPKDILRVYHAKSENTFADPNL
jgi:ABC-type polysaccharide/polyol phosphate transport system ATPase subunit